MINNVCMKWQIVCKATGLWPCPQFQPFLSVWGFFYANETSPSLEPRRSPEHGSLHSSVPQCSDPDLALFWRLSSQRSTGQPCAISKRILAAVQPQAFPKAKDPWTVSSSTNRPNPLWDFSTPCPFPLILSPILINADWNCLWVCSTSVDLHSANICDACSLAGFSVPEGQIN